MSTKRQHRYHRQARQSGHDVEVADEQLQAVPVVLAEPRVISDGEVGRRRVPDQAIRDEARAREPEAGPGPEREEDRRGAGPRGNAAATAGAGRVMEENREPRPNPHPVVVPADRGDQEPGQCAGQQAFHGPARPVQRGGGRETQHRDERGREHPPRDPGRHGPGQPGDRSAQGLVLQVPDESRSPRVEEKAVKPPPGRVPRQHGKANGNRGGERARRHGGLPQPSGKGQIRNKDQRNEFDAGRDAHARADPFALPRLAQVPDDQGHQQQVHLAELKSAHDRLGPQHRGGQQQGRAEPGAVPRVAQAPEGHPDSAGQRGHAGDPDQSAQHRKRQQRHRGEQDRGEGRVGELHPRN
jgi:hypothetical protein